MTDKQIIIDGTKCKYAHFDGGNTQRLLCAIDDCFCDCYRDNDCYYKQLKRKEQECERLNEHSVGFARKCQNLELDVCHLKDKNYNLQRQLNQLKAELEQEKNWHKTSDEISKVNSEYTAKLKQTLTEIKEIAEWKNEYWSLGIDDYKNMADEILQICNEVTE